MLPFDKRQVKNVASCVVACVGSQQSVLWYWQVYLVLNAPAVPLSTNMHATTTYNLVPEGNVYKLWFFRLLQVS